ncbi:uncharacterized protein B0P05DRAFT_549336 [Gilbertella persicaria]|uniref:uncharacterized protein n=1 Tax=Gilbertella persicaria TaxID=101096 RepID=UPI00221F9320|nr:uncharacterized protein B0P05DRAFT_549336 [Gilbertella persicaria]KAI8072207.1 hypothetical protein B0P05DRAFT_549336 [Gilbertella persicaria]
MGGGGGGGSYYDFDDELAEEKDMHSVSQQDSSKTNQLNLSIQSPIHSPVHSPINSPIELTKDSPTHSLIESARHSLAYSSTHSSIELNRHSHVDSLINSPTKHSFDSSPIDSITESIKRSLDKSTINSSIRSTKHLSVDLPVNLPMDSSNILPQSTPISINNTNSASIRSPISSPTTDLSSHPNATSEKEESVIQLPPSAVSRSSISPYKSNRMTSNHIPEQLNYAEDEYASMTIIESNTDDSKRHIRSSFKQEKKPAPKEGCCCIIC